MIALWILLGLLLLILLVLFLPVKAHLQFEDQFKAKITLVGIKVFEVKPDEQKPEKEVAVDDSSAEADTEKGTKKLFSILKKKHGFMGAVKTVISFCRDCLMHIKVLLPHIKFDKVLFNLNVAGKDAAATAVEYGIACSVAYPMLALLDCSRQVKLKEINIRSDFTANKCEFNFSAVIGCKIIFLLVAVVKILNEYKRFKERENL